MRTSRQSSCMQNVLGLSVSCRDRRDAVSHFAQELCSTFVRFCLSLTLTLTLTTWSVSMTQLPTYLYVVSYTGRSRCGRTGRVTDFVGPRARELVLRGQGPRCSVLRMDLHTTTRSLCPHCPPNAFPRGASCVCVRSKWVRVRRGSQCSVWICGR